jgi:hypothetical protein
MNARWQLAAACSVLLACAGESGDSGIAEPLRIAGAVFKSGELPGRAPAGEDDEDPGPLSLTTIETNNTVIHPGQVGKRISGRALDSGYAVAARFEDQGSGYWIKYLDEADSAYPGELEFRLDLELAHNLPLGPQRLLFSVIDAGGRASRQQALNLCVTSPYDRALNACDPTQKPPAAVITLTWESSADLDLIVRTPDGELVDARHPSTLTDPALEGEQDPAFQGILYTSDARGCDVRSVRREDLVWANEVPEGRYDVFVNLFDACGARSTFFEVSYATRAQRDDETYSFRTRGQAVLGQLIDEEANGGTRPHRKIASFDLP